jgi:hypothetical protein
VVGAVEVPHLPQQPAPVADLTHAHGLEQVAAALLAGIVATSSTRRAAGQWASITAPSWPAWRSMLACQSAKIRW